VKLKTRNEANNSLRYEDDRLRERVCGRTRWLRKLIETACRSHDSFVANQASQCLRPDSFSDEVLEPEHTPVS
jgi:hypothetical protein